MQRLTVVCSCMLLVVAASINVVVANGGGKVPYYPRVCVGEEPDQCCREISNIDYEAICSKQLVIFPKGCGVSLDSPEAATVMSSLVSSISSVAFITDPDKQAKAACVVRNSWSQIGADFLSIKFYFFNKPLVISSTPVDTPLVAAGGGAYNITFTGGAALFKAGDNIYMVFSGIKSSGGFPNYPIEYSKGGVTGKTNDLWLSYYEQAFKAAGNDIIADALACLSPGKKLYIAGWSAGGIAAIYASLDLQEKGVLADHIYLFGNSKPGDEYFVTSYKKTPAGEHTSDWWNKLDINPVLPPKDYAQKVKMNAAVPGSADGWEPTNQYKLLDSEVYWRIVPADIIIKGVRYYKGQCHKVHDKDDPFYTACPSYPTNKNNVKCGLNQDDHNIRDYLSSIKACVLHGPKNIIHRRRDVFNPSCITDVRIDP